MIDLVIDMIACGAVRAASLRYHCVTTRPACTTTNASVSVWVSRHASGAYRPSTPRTGCPSTSQERSTIGNATPGPAAGWPGGPG